MKSRDASLSRIMIPGRQVMEADIGAMPIDSDRANPGDSVAPAMASAISIDAEWLAYIGLALLALFLRITMLDSVPISDAEARQALHAWHAIEDDAPGAFATSSSPLTYLAQLTTFSLLGANELSARLASALAGLALAMTPLLFRDSLGRTRTFVWAVLLSLLTTPLAASRSADGASFVLLFTILAVWMIRRYWYSLRLRDAYWATAFVTAMLLLSGPAGVPLLLILLLAGWLAVWRTALSAPQRLELPGDDILQMAVTRAREFPFAKVLIVPFLLVATTATLFMLNPSGLSTIGQLFESAISGVFHNRSASGARLGLAVLLLQEPLLIIFSLGGAWLLWKHGDVTYVDRFAAAWAALGAVGLLLYPGAGPADALWVVVPLTLLASYGITQLLVNRRVVLLWSAGDENEDESQGESDGLLYTTQYWWAKWAISAAVLLCLFILSVQFMQVARLLTILPAEMTVGELFAFLADPSQLRLAQGLSLLLASGVIAAIVFLLVANFWGLGTCLQGAGIGYFVFLLLSGLGGAWQAAVADAHYPDGLWRESAVSEDAYLLRDTLFELADRHSSGFPALELAIVADSGGIIREDGLMAWLVRDFPNARFVRAASAADGQAIIIMADDQVQTAAISGNYVGQRFTLRRKLALNEVDRWDLPAWWSHGQLDADRIEEEAVVLWLRQDVYDGATLD